MQGINNEVKKKDWKNDRADNKLRWELLPLDLIEDLVKVYDAGAKKYEPDSWKYVENGYERYKGALLRHLLKSDTEDIDEETDCYHLAQVAWNALTMLWFKKQQINRTDLNDFATWAKWNLGNLDNLIEDDSKEDCAILKPIHIQDNPKNVESLNTTINTTMNDEKTKQS